MGVEANKVAGTMCNDAYQQFMDKFVAINKEMSEIYQKSKTDTTLTDDQRKDLEKQLAEKIAWELKWFTTALMKTSTTL